MQTYIKCVNLSRKKFDEINNDAFLRYRKLKEKDRISFSMFQQSILFAYILGNLTAHRDKEAMDIFFAAISSCDIPRIKIIQEKDNVRICTAVLANKKICKKIK